MEILQERDFQISPDRRPIHEHTPLPLNVSQVSSPAAYQVSQRAVDPALSSRNAVRGPIHLFVGNLTHIVDSQHAISTWRRLKTRYEKRRSGRRGRRPRRTPSTLNGSSTKLSELTLDPERQRTAPLTCDISPYGKPGCGAPLRTGDGRVITVRTPLITSPNRIETHPSR